MRVRLIYRKAPHHATHSGYHLLARNVEAAEGRGGALFTVLKWLAEKVARVGPGQEERWYPRRAFYLDLAIALGNLIPRGGLWHFLDGEDLVRISSRMPVRWNNRVVATFHQPPRLLERLLDNKRFIAGLDAAIALSREQAGWLAGVVGRERVHFVEHGIDTEFWRPGGSRAEKPVFLTVGSWLRDLGRLGRLARELGASHPEWRFRLVAPGDALEGLEGVEQVGGLSDEELREEYRRAWAVLLPLEDATANNALLEGLACGTPVVVTRVGGVQDYVGNDCARLVEPGEEHGYREALQALARDPDKVAAMGRAGRQRAEAFAWRAIGQRMEAVYRKVMGAPR